ncbi:MAG: hypothetical protein NTY53_23940 [Kiritimatiellaeota bacterium]|nr:hypothetical protein [Kiritimatiellota bacterium]
MQTGPMFPSLLIAGHVEFSGLMMPHYEGKNVPVRPCMRPLVMLFNISDRCLPDGWL